MMHALVVGGTGMLAGVTLELARRGHRVTVISRRAELFATGTPNLNRVSLDYHSTDVLRQAVLGAQDQWGGFGLMVAWIHGTVPEAPWVIAGAARAYPCRFVHVLGSAAANPASSSSEHRARFGLLKQLQYTEVILGFRLEGSHSRWLTDNEISTGVLQAVENSLPRVVVGTVEPWSARPGF